MEPRLDLVSVVGFSGSEENTLLLHPDGRKLVYPLGSTVVLRDKDDATSQARRARAAPARGPGRGTRRRGHRAWEGEAAGAAQHAVDGRRRSPLCATPRRAHQTTACARVPPTAPLPAGVPAGPLRPRVGDRAVAVGALPRQRPGHVPGVCSGHLHLGLPCARAGAPAAAAEGARACKDRIRRERAGRARAHGGCWRHAHVCAARRPRAAPRAARVRHRPPCAAPSAPCAPCAPRRRSRSRRWPSLQTRPCSRRSAAPTTTPWCCGTSPAGTPSAAAPPTRISCCGARARCMQAQGRGAGGAAACGLGRSRAAAACPQPGCKVMHASGCARQPLSATPGAHRTTPCPCQLGVFQQRQHQAGDRRQLQPAGLEL
jgi:hypothetical protein